MTPAQIHQKYPYYNYFPSSSSGANYLYYNGYSHGDGKGESTWEKSVQMGIPGLDQSTLLARGREHFPMVDQSQLQQFHRPLYADPMISQALDLSAAQARLQQPPTFSSPSFPAFNQMFNPPQFPTFNPQFAQNGIQQQLFFPGR
uniref:Uncharacterized protein n=1 Tax=Panagrolaimus sp. PS1159 TaxID=55785 RepID=A0AC35ESR7_9BILA